MRDPTKLYPAMNPMFIQAIKMPRLWSRIIANGPIGPDAVRSWLDAGAMSPAPDFTTGTLIRVETGT